jgi:glucose-1-phosphate adenylyltransferase
LAVLTNSSRVLTGEVKNSILFRGVKVAKGAVVKNSILFQDSQIGSNTKLNCVIADKQAVILDKRNLSGHDTHPYFIAKNTVI